MNIIHTHIIFVILGIILGILQRKQNAPITLYIFIGFILSLCPFITYYALEYNNELPKELSLLWSLSGLSIFLTWPLILKCNKYLRIGITIFCIIITSISIITLNKKIPPELPITSVMHDIIYTVAQSEINNALSTKIVNGTITNKGYYTINGENIGVKYLKKVNTPSNKKNKNFKSESTLLVFLNKDIKIINLESNDDMHIYMISGEAEINIEIAISPHKNENIQEKVKTFNSKIKINLNGILKMSEKETIFTKIGIKI